jgi:hypothetical protein
MADPARSLKQRQEDARARLNGDVDAWVATSDGEGGTPYLVPLSYVWDGESLLMATPASNPTSRNMRATGKVRVALGPTRDVLMIDGTVDAFTPEALPAELGDAFAERTGFDPRAVKGTWLYFRIRPQVIQAWREANEISGRDVMLDGVWLDSD